MDVDLVRRRVETKYRITTSAAEAMIEAFPEAGLERREAWVRTVYLDRPDRRLARAAEREPRAAVKIRLREYEDGALWVELKTRDAAWSRKRRFRLVRERLGDFLNGTLRGLEPDEDDETLRGIRAAAPGPLSPLGEVRYLRTSIQEPRARLTLDRHVTYAAEGREILEEGAVVEVKHADDPPPEWCRTLLGRRAPVEYSKFGRLCRLLGAR